MPLWHPDCQCYSCCQCCCTCVANPDMAEELAQSAADGPGKLPAPDTLGQA